METIFGLIYGADTVQHILSGKAYARAVRSHCLLVWALVTKLLQRIIISTERNNQGVACDETLITDADVSEIKTFVAGV